MSTKWVPIGPSVIPNGGLSTSSLRFFVQPDVGHGPVAGRVSALALSPDGGTIYAGAASGGVWRSTDEGVTWTATMDALPTLAVGAIAVAHNGWVYVGTGETNEDTPDRSGVMSGVGVYLSKDRGDTWELLATGIDLIRKQISRIVVHPTNEKQLYVATTAGLLTTTDLVDWKQLRAASEVCDVAVDFHDPANPRIYAALKSKGVFAADGAPQTDADLHELALPFRDFERIGLALMTLPGQPPPLFAVFENNDRLAHFMSRTRAATTWSVVPDSQMLSGARQLGYNMLLAIDPSDPSRMFFGEVELYRFTRDKSWHIVSRPSGVMNQGSYQGVHVDHHAIAFHPTRPDTIWLANDGGVYVSTDGGEHFYGRNRGLNTIQIYTFSQHPSESDLMYAGTQDNGGLRYTGHPAWRRVTNGDVFHAVIHPAMPNVWFATHGDGIERSLLIGRDVDTFTDVNKGLHGRGQAKWVTLAGDPTTGTTAFAAMAKVFWSHLPKPHGQTWELVEAADDPSEAQVTAIAIARTSTTVYYARGLENMGEEFAIPATLYRIDLGADGQWEKSASVTLDAECFQILIDEGDPDRFIIVLGSWKGPGAIKKPVVNRILRGRFADEEITLEPLGQLHADQPLEIGTFVVPSDMMQVNCIVRDPAHASTLFVGTDYGVYRSTDAGTTWAPFGEGLPAAAVVSGIHLHPDSRRLRVSTMGRGVWECALDEPDRDHDLCVRDLQFDRGRGTTPETRSDPGGLGELHWHDAPDLKLDTESIVFGDFEMPSSVRYDGAALDYIGFETLAGDAPRARSTSRVYVQVHNRGPKKLDDVAVRVFIATKAGSGYPALPADFWTTFETGAFSTGAWRALGPAQTLHDLRAAEPQVARFDHEFHGAGDTIGLLAVVTSPQDPVPVLALDVEQAVRADKRVILKQLEVKTSVLEIVVETAIVLGLIAGGTYLILR